jgi:hypothetical protein
MRNAIKPLFLTSALALAACQGKHQEGQDQNIVIDSGNIPANADIEALPPDESSGTSTEELANGADDADVNGAINAPDNQTDSY